MKLIEVTHHDDSIQDRLSKEGDEADCGRYTQMDSRHFQSKYASDQSERHIHQDERGVFCGAKRIQQQRKNEQHADRHNQCQTLHRALLVLELTAPGDVISRRQFDLLRNTILHLGDKAAHIAVLDEDADGHDARAELTADIQAALLDGNRCQRIERDPRAGGRIHKYPFDGVDAALFLLQPDGDAESSIAFPHFSGFFSAERGLNNVLNV